LQELSQSLTIPEQDFRFLFGKLGPSLGLWRAAEVAVLRAVACRADVLTPPVLDLGCGDGLVTSLVLPRVDIGVDPNRAAIAQAASLGVYQRLLPDLMEAAGLPEASVGTILSNSVLEHVASIDTVLASIYRALKPGGWLIFTCPTHAFSSWLSIPSARYAARRNAHYQHLNLWPVEEWDCRLARAGLRLEYVHPYLRPGWVRAWDALELLQMIYIRRTRVFGKVWRSLPPAWLDALARRAARLDLSAPQPGGGRLIAAQKV
jgi:SAM-dependent methyltransferase